MTAPALHWLRRRDQNDFVRIRVADLISLIESETDLLVRLGEMAESRTIEVRSDDRALRAVEP